MPSMTAECPKFRMDSYPSEALGNIYKVGNIEEAIELTVKFKRDKRYDWFRGQTQGWPLISSLSRLADMPDELRKAEHRLVVFIAWLKRTPGLKRFTTDIDKVLAIAQHYGMPTALLDFTTSPAIAGYFAAAAKVGNKNDMGYIYCLNTVDLGEFWSIMRKCLKTFKEAPPVEFIRPKLPDLWRLEAQHGVFLYGPPNWAQAYPPDCIIFPQSGLPSYPGEDDVYPSRKSQLESLLNHYFQVNWIADWQEAVWKAFPEAKVLQLNPPPNRTEPEFFKRGKLPILPCWKPKYLKAWQCMKEERFQRTAVGEVALRLNLRSDAKILRERASFGVLRALEIDPNLRRKAVRWMLLPQKRLNAQLSRSLDRLWNGMRVLPYSNLDIAEAVGLCFALYRLGFSGAKEGDALRISSTLLGKTELVSFGSWDGSYAKALVSVNDLRTAVRDDINKYLLPEHWDKCRFVQPLLQLCSSPSRLFPFDRFVGIFGRQLIPCQVLQGENSPVFFSPARLEGFGLP